MRGRIAKGEASLLAEPDEGPPLEPVDRPERFLIRKLGREFLVAANDIEVTWWRSTTSHPSSRWIPATRASTCATVRCCPAVDATART